MATAILTLRLPEETKAKLDKLAQATHRSKSYLAEEAIARYLDLDSDHSVTREVEHSAVPNIRFCPCRFPGSPRLP